MKRVISTICFLVVIVIANIAVWPPKNTLVDHSEMPKHRRRAYFTILIEKLKPQIVLIGNSILNSSVDEAAFSGHTRTRTVKLWIGGSSSAWWYAVTKNVVAKAMVKPKIAVIFFRDHYLTDPGFRVYGEFKLRLNDMLSDDDELIDRLVYLKRMNWFTYNLSKYSPLFQKRAAIKRGFNASVKDALVGRSMGLEKGKTDEAIARVFDDKNMDEDILTTRQLSAESNYSRRIYDFKSCVKKSFLPHTIEVAKKKNIKLVFVRMKRKRDAETVTQPKMLKKYIDDLDAYLEKNDCGFIDFTYDPRIKTEHFASGDHLTLGQGRKVFTKILAEQMAKLLQDKIFTQK